MVEATQNTGSIDLTQNGVTNRFTLELDASDPNRPLVQVRVERIKEGEETLAALTIRHFVTESNDRVAADFPACNSAVCHTDESGHITNE